MIYNLVLGDWAEDGHGRSKNILVDCNCESVTDIQNAYKASCRKLGIQFNNDEDYTGKNLSRYDPHLIWTEYGDFDMSDIAYDILNKAGCLNGIEVEENDSGYCIDRMYCDEYYSCAQVIMNFIALSMPEDFTYKIIEVEQEYPCINGYGDGMSILFGYGLFDIF